MVNYESLIMVKADMENELQETKDLLLTTRIDIEKLIVKNEIYNRSLQTQNKMEQYKRKIAWNNDIIKRYECNVAEYIDTINEFENELDTLKTMIVEYQK